MALFPLLFPLLAPFFAPRLELMAEILALRPQLAGFWRNFSKEGRLSLFQLLHSRQALLPIPAGSGHT
jgi:hypothetical protein